DFGDPVSSDRSERAANSYPCVKYHSATFSCDVTTNLNSVTRMFHWTTSTGRSASCMIPSARPTRPQASELQPSQASNASFHSANVARIRSLRRCAEQTNLEAVEELCRASSY